MDYSKALQYALELQDISLKLNEIPFNIYLKNTGDILTLCFLEAEKSDCLIVVETNQYGAEELRIIPKINIEYISIFYDFDSLEEKPKDKMFL